MKLNINASINNLKITFALTDRSKYLSINLFLSKRKIVELVKRNPTMYSAILSPKISKPENVLPNNKNKITNI